MTGKQLQKSRHALGLNTSALARLLDVSPRTVEDWEQGRYSIPDVVVLKLTGECPCCKKSASELKIEVPKGGS